MSLPNRSADAALATLILLQVTMLSALYAGIAPHPPAATPLFGMAPFLAASISAAASALILRPTERIGGRALAGLAALLALVSFGPQKFLDPQIALIWPAVVAGQVSALVVLAGVLRARLARPVAGMA